MNSCNSLTSSYTVRRDDIRGAVVGGLAPAILFFANPWGVSQNLILWEPLLWQGIPAGKWLPHPRHWHSRGPPPLDLQQQQGNTHASLLPTLSSQWGTGPQTDGQLVFEWFWVTFLLFVSVCWAKSERSRTVSVWLQGGVCVTICPYRVMFCCFSTHTAPKWPVMPPITYSMESTSPCGLLFFSTWNIPRNNACQCGL